MSQNNEAICECVTTASVWGGLRFDKFVCIFMNTTVSICIRTSIKINNIDNNNFYVIMSMKITTTKVWYLNDIGIVWYPKFGYKIGNEKMWNMNPFFLSGIWIPNTGL